MNKNSLVITVLVAVITLCGGFFAGMKYQQSKRLNGPFGNFTGVSGQKNGINGSQNDRIMGGFRPVNGSILSIDDSGITVKLTDGSSKIVMISDTTSINNVQTAVKTDLKVGETVMVVGQVNSDGSVSAQNIQINPIVRGQEQVKQ